MTGRASDSELCELDPAEERRLALLLRHAFAPSELDPERHERILRSALEDPFAAASADELIESERLRQALEGRGEHPALALAQALSAAHSPSALPPLASPDEAQTERRRALPRTGRVVYYRFGAAASLLAAAAAVLLAVHPRGAPDSGRASASAEAPPLALLQSRSTASMFPPDSAGAASDRIDRIATYRARELRDNRYALWGVR